MGILNYTTTVDSIKTITQIQQCLVKSGATKIVIDYEEALPTSLTFCILNNEKNVVFNLPCNYEGILSIMSNDKKVPKRLCTKEQAMRVSWRILKDWVEAQIAIVQAQMATPTEVFLPYALTKQGETVYKYLTNSKHTDQFLLTH